MTKFTKTILACGLTIGLVSFTTSSIPNGWFKAGSVPEAYNMGVDKTTFKVGNSSATIQSTKKRIKGFWYINAILQR